MRLKGIKTPLSLPELTPIKLNTEHQDTLQLYIPGAIRSKLSAGQSKWLAELRRLTVLFIHLQNIDVNTSLPLVHEAIKGLQESLYYYEGSINKISVDDKGIVGVAALGMPPPGS